MDANFPRHQERPYHVDRTTSRPLCEVKRRRARLVLRWGTTWEALVLFLFCLKDLILPTLQPPSIYHRTRPAPTYRRLDLIACEDTRGSQLLLPRPSLRTNANNELHAAPRGPPTCLLHQENTPGTNQVQRSPYSRRSSRIRTYPFIHN